MGDVIINVDDLTLTSRKRNKEENSNLKKIFL